jgi:hypothetical protein
VQVFLFFKLKEEDVRPVFNDILLAKLNPGQVKYNYDKLKKFYNK